MLRSYKKGFLIVDKSWFDENEFFTSLSHAEFRIMLYLLSSVLRVSKKNGSYKNGELIAHLYQNSNLLAASVSYTKIAEKCRVNRATVYRALDKFNEVGAAIKIPGIREKRINNIYIVGLENTQDEGRVPYFFADSVPLSSGGTMPEDIKEFICKNYRDGKRLLFTNLDGYGKTLAPVLFHRKGEGDGWLHEAAAVAA